LAHNVLTFGSDPEAHFVRCLVAWTQVQWITASITVSIQGGPGMQVFSLLTSDANSTDPLPQRRRSLWPGNGNGVAHGSHL